MASHMRTDDTPTTQRVVSREDDGRHSSNQVIDEGVRVEAQDVRSSRKYFYTPDRGKAARTKHGHRHHHSGRGRKRGGCLRVFLIIFGLFLAAGIAVGGMGYVYGKQFYASARTVKAEAQTAIDKVSDLKTQITTGDYAGAQASAEELSSIASQMQEETSGELWDLASRLPVYGGDVQKVRTLAIVFRDLSDNALIPVTQELSGLSFSAIIGTEGNIDVNALVGLTNALSNVSDVIDRNAATVDSLGEAKLDQINDPLQKVRAQMSDLNGMTQGALKITPVLSQMLGADGQTRHYLIVAVSPAEMRAGGGFAGSTGMLTVTDGKLELGDFESFAGRVWDDEFFSAATEEELAAFGNIMLDRFDNLNVTPNFPRVGTLYADMWLKRTGEVVDGVISIDPVFLQRVLALTGGVEVSNGWTVDGDNAAELVLNTIYLEYEQNQDMDAVFAEVAEAAFKKFTSNIGQVGLTNVMGLISQSAQDYRLQVWMANADEEAAMDELGISGALETDPTNPVLGVFLNDYTWAKMGWYLDFRTTVDGGTRNADGSMTYHATTIVRNAMNASDAPNMPEYIAGINPSRRNACDMSSSVQLFPPAGGSISNIQTSNGTSPAWKTAYGFDFAILDFWTNVEETTTITYDVTTSAQAIGELQIRTTPTCRTFD